MNKYFWKLTLIMFLILQCYERKLFLFLNKLRLTLILKNIFKEDDLFELNFHFTAEKRKYEIS
jgi:hypothetical protein